MDDVKVSSNIELEVMFLRVIIVHVQVAGLAASELFSSNYNHDTQQPASQSPNSLTTSIKTPTYEHYLSIQLLLPSTELS
jgi:hypothetical protein